VNGKQKSKRLSHKRSRRRRESRSPLGGLMNLRTATKMASQDTESSSAPSTQHEGIVKLEQRSPHATGKELSDLRDLANQLARDFSIGHADRKRAYELYQLLCQLVADASLSWTNVRTNTARVLGASAHPRRANNWRRAG